MIAAVKVGYKVRVLLQYRDKNTDKVSDGVSVPSK
jgi:hypothetical protein